MHETNIQNKLSAIQVWFSLVCAYVASSGVTSPPRGEVTTTFFQAQHLTEGNPRARRSASTASNSEENMTVSSKVRCVDCDTGDTAPVLLLSLCFIQMNLVESLLLMSTSSSRSLALTCLYSLYSTASGERSSFWTFLQEQGGNRYDAARKKPSCRGFSLCSSKYLTLTNSFFSYLPFCLKNWSSNSFKFLRILFFSSLVSWSCSTSSCLWGEEKCFFKCLTLKYTQTSSIYKKNPQKSTTLARFLFFLYYTGHTGGRQLVSKQIKSVLDWLQLLCNTMAKVCKQPLADKHFAINLNGCALSVMFLCNMGLDLIRCQMVVSWLYSYIKARLLGNSV